MVQTLTAVDVLSITTEERLKGTNRFLPTESLPAIEEDDPYYRVIDALYTGAEIPEAVIRFNAGFPDTEAFEEALFRFLMAHLIYIEVDSDTRLRGLSYLLKQIVTLSPVED